MTKEMARWIVRGGAAALVSLALIGAAPPQERESGADSQGGASALIEQMARDDFAGQDASMKLAAIGAPAVPELIEATRHDVPRVRYWSIAALSSIGDDRAVPAIKECLSDPDPTVRAVATWHLSRWFDREDVQEAVVSMLGDESAFVRGWAFRLVTERQHGGALDRVTELLNSEHEEDRYSALRAVAAIQGKRSVEALKKAFDQDQSSLVRTAALYHLGDYIERKDVQEIILRALQEKDKDVRSWALKVVREKRFAPAMANVLLLVQHRDEEVRYDALHTAAVLRGPEAVDLLKSTVRHDKHALVRLCAVQSCTVIEPPTPRTAEVLIEALSDDDEEVRDAASQLLRKGFDQNFGFFALATIGDREKAILQWDRWYQSNKDKLRWDEERSVFTVPGETTGPHGR